MIIRPIIEGDLSICGEIYAQAFNGPPYKEIWTPEVAAEMLSGLLSRDPHSCWCLEIGGIIAGFSFCTQFGTFRATIQEFAISPSFQKKGLGTKLMEYTLNKFSDRNVEIADLAVNRDASAYLFYHRFGFRQSENYLIMAKWI